MKPFPFEEALLVLADPAKLTNLLENHFGNDDSYEIVLPDESDPNSEGQKFTDGSSVVVCTSYAAQVFREIEHFGNPDLHCKIVGFSSESNPESSIANEWGGHDFALINDRYIVDGWLKNVDETSPRSVFDLESIEDKNIIKQLYGDMSTIERLAEYEASLTNEKRTSSSKLRP